MTYLGYVHGTQAALRRMLPRDEGTIIQIGSALAYRSIPLQSAYCAAKAAVRGFTSSLRYRADPRRQQREAVHAGASRRQHPPVDPPAKQDAQAAAARPAHVHPGVHRGVRPSGRRSTQPARC